MINFPDEGHWVLKPANSFYWHNEIFKWLKQYVPPGAMLPYALPAPLHVPFPERFPNLSSTRLLSVTAIGDVFVTTTE